MTSLEMLERSCGRCTACCHVLGVVELEKPFFCDCPHEVKKKGCGIYETRPGSCRHWKCSWLAGELPRDNFRPDQLGLVLWPVDDPKGRLLMIAETRPNVLANLSRDRAIAVVRVAVQSGREAVPIFYGDERCKLATMEDKLAECLQTGAMPASLHVLDRDPEGCFIE